MTLNSTSRVLVAVAAAIFSAALSACAGGGTTNGTLPQTQTPTTQQQHAAPVVNAPSSGVESIVRDVTPATETFTYTTLGTHLMPVYPKTVPGAVSTHSSTPFPLDLSYSKGPLAGQITFHNVYINCSTGGGSCWGNPYQFLNDLGHSSMIHVLDQYDGTVSLTAGASYGEARVIFSNVLYFNDLLRFLHHAVSKFGGANAAGLGHMYNIFLAPGLDTCFDLSTVCYSPDNGSTFAFCAYHAAVQFSDFGVVIFSVEPFQAVPGCNFHNVKNLDSGTANSLGHETFEAMSDPIPPSGWTNTGANPSFFGAEIGDECAWSSIAPVTLNGRTYDIQWEYSNKGHRCASAPI